MTESFRFIVRGLRALIEQIERLELAGNHPATGVAYDDLARAVLETRKARGESQRDVGVSAGVDPGIVHRIEHGKPVAPRQLAAIAKWLGRPIVFPP